MAAPWALVRRQWATVRHKATRPVLALRVREDALGLVRPGPPFVGSFLRSLVRWFVPLFLRGLSPAAAGCCVSGVRATDASFRRSCAPNGNHQRLMMHVCTYVRTYVVHCGEQRPVSPIASTRASTQEPSHHGGHPLVQYNRVSNCFPNNFAPCAQPIVSTTT